MAGTGSIGMRENEVNDQIRNEDATDAQYSTYVNSIGQATDQIKAGKATMEEAKKKLEENDAEKMASEALAKKGAPLTLAEASALLDQEKKAKQAYRDTAKNNIQDSIETLRNAAKGSKEVIGAAIDDFKRGAGDRVGVGGTLGLLGLGAVTGALIPAAGRGLASNAIETVKDAWTDLNENNPTDGEDKYVEGYESAEKAGESVEYDSQKKPTGFNPGVGEDAKDEKTPGYTYDYKAPDADDALNATPDVLSAFANLGKGATTSDLLRAFSEKTENSPDLLSSIASKAADVIADRIDNKNSTKSAAELKLEEENEKLEKGDTNNPDVSGPDV